MKSVRVHGHFGEYLQGRLGPDGPLGLITVPCRGTGLTARLCSGDRQGACPPERFLRSLGLAGSREIVVCPMSPPGAGTGISTAALIAAARLHGWEGPPGSLMAACVAHVREAYRDVGEVHGEVPCQGASDPLAFPRPERLLWASREGRILRRMPALPPHDIVGGYFGPPCATDPRDLAFPDVSDLARSWAAARKLHAFAELASESARRCLQLRGPAGDPTEDLARSLGALGHVIAHTGSARGLIFAKGEVPPDAASALRAAGLTGVRQFGSDDL